LQSGQEDNCIAIDWHLGERDFTTANASRLLRVARRCQEGLPIAFVFDRRGRTVALAEGLDQRHPALLLSVKLNLPRFLDHLSAREEPEHFLRKLASLARLALSAGLQRREFLRRQGKTRTALTSGFLLERARLAVVPVGIETVARRVLGESPCTSGNALAFAKSVVQRLKESLREDGRAYLLDCCIDSCFEDRFEVAFANPSRLDALGGLTFCDETITPRGQIEAAGALHGSAEAGTAVVLNSPGRPLMAEEIVDLLHYGWRHSEALRIQFAKTCQEGSQAALWERSHNSALPQRAG
jgi:hypothetical protein